MGSTIENSIGFGISLDELSNEKEIKDILTFIASSIGKEEHLENIKFDKGFQIESIALRSREWMQQDIFTNYQSETELMRYIFRLAEKDFSLVDGMLSLIHI